MRQYLVFGFLVTLVGCGGSGQKTDSLSQVVTDLDLAIADAALEVAQIAAEAARPREPDEDSPIENPIRQAQAVIGQVAGESEAFVQAVAGKPIESAAKAFLADVQQLNKMASSPGVTLKQIEQGLNDLRPKVQELKTKL